MNVLDVESQYHKQKLTASDDAENNRQNSVA